MTMKYIRTGLDIPYELRWLGCTLMVDGKWYFYDPDREGATGLMIDWCPKIGFMIEVFNHSDDVGDFKDSCHLKISPFLFTIALKGYWRIPFIKWGPAWESRMWSFGTEIGGEHDGTRHGSWQYLRLARGFKSRIKTMPWAWIHRSLEYQCADGSWALIPERWEDHDHIYRETYPCEYKLRSGKIQRFDASVSMQRRTFHRKWFPWIKYSVLEIDVKFSSEVGERAGSWKGGTIGCGWEVLPGESIRDCLYRMMAVRKFE